MFFKAQQGAHEGQLRIQRKARLCFGAKEMQALLLESTTNLVPESDLTLNLKPVSLLNKKKALLDVAIAKPKQSNRTGK